MDICPMALSKHDVEYIAHLARLEVSDDEIADYVDKLSSIIDLVAQLGELDTSAVMPMAHPLDMSQRLRPDEVTETNQRDLYQRNGQAVGRGFYRVPRVID
jgi:aspartyl-tRNA(Asn)/glutamyl-tRNA(Gln) amidotransferase subunit C